MPGWFMECSARAGVALHRRHFHHLVAEKYYHGAQRTKAGRTWILACACKTAW